MTTRPPGFGSVAPSALDHLGWFGSLGLTPQAKYVSPLRGSIVVGAPRSLGLTLQNTRVSPLPASPVGLRRDRSRLMARVRSQKARQLHSLGLSPSPEFCRRLRLRPLGYAVTGSGSCSGSERRRRDRSIAWGVSPRNTPAQIQEARNGRQTLSLGAPSCAIASASVDSIRFGCGEDGVNPSRTRRCDRGREPATPL